MAHKDDKSISEELNARDVPRYSSTLEDIDYAVYNFFNDYLDLKTSTNKGFRKTPVVWSGAERAHNIKDDDINRDLVGQVALPIISIERASMKKTDKSRVIPYAVVDPVGDIKGGFLTVNRVIKQDKTSNFANADAFRRKKQLNYPLYRNKDNGKIVFETIKIPIPIYVEVGYKIAIRTDYQQQMNDLITPIIRTPNAQRMVKLTYGGNVYEAVVQEDYTTENVIVNYETNERKYETTVSIDVYGYLIGDGDNQTQPRTSRRENPVQIRFARERLIVQDEEGEFRF